MQTAPQNVIGLRLVPLREDRPEKGPRSGMREIARASSLDCSQEEQTMRQRMRVKCCRKKNCKGECRKPRRYYANFCKVNPRTGKKVYYGQSLDALEHEEFKAFKNLSDLYDRAGRGEPTRGSKTKFKDLLKRYDEWMSSVGQKSPLTIADNKGRLKKVLLPVFGDSLVINIGDEKILEFKRDREAEGRAGSTLKKDFRVVSEICSLVNPAFKLPVFKKWKNKKTVQYAWSEAEVWRVYSFLEKSRSPDASLICDAFTVMAYTGMDTSDVLALTPSDIQDGFILKNRGKTSEKISAFLLIEVVELLEERRLSNGRYFPDVENGGATARTINGAIRRAAKKAGLGGGSKSLRHHYVTQLELAGFNDDEIQSFAGHAKGSRMTAGYKHGIREKMRKAFHLSRGGEARAL